MDELTWNSLVTVESRVDRTIVGALRGRDLSGFEIWRWLGAEQGTAGVLTETALYPTLYRLEAERLLQSDWHEGDRTRRTYRLTANALQKADENGWPALPFRATPTVHAAPVQNARMASPDPEAGAWFVPPRSDPAQLAEPAWWSRLPAPTSDGGRDGRRGAVTGSGADSRFAAVARYANDLGSALDLPRIDAGRVRQEIADHLTDSASMLRQGGTDEGQAATEAIDRLGDFRDLAARIGRAQQTKDRRDRAIRRGLLEFVGEIVLWLAVTAVPFAFGPGLADAVTALGQAVGLHLVVLGSAEWATNQMAALLCVGAFAAGRLSLGHAARISHHSDASIRKRWGVVGALAVLVIALLLPGCPDGLVVATLLAAPLAFVAGTLRPKHQNESAYTWRALATVAVFVAMVTLMPAARLFAYDPNGTPGAPLSQGVGPDRLTVFQFRDGTFGYELPGSTTFADVEVWPASPEGLFIVPDRSAGGPTLSAVAGVDMAKLPPRPQWWIAAVVVGPDGHRTAAAVAIQTGNSPGLSNALSWLISRL